jgi:hypothetical protein
MWQTVYKFKLTAFCRTPSNTVTTGNISQILNLSLRGRRNSSAGKGTIHEDRSVHENFFPDFFKTGELPIFRNVRPENQMET